MLFACLSQFSDSKGQRFESPRPHQKRSLYCSTATFCLIIDEIGHCAFDKENTRLFFDLIDRRYNKEGSFNMIFTSNKNPALWREDFEEDATLLCTLDRIFDDAIRFILSRITEPEAGVLRPSRAALPRCPAGCPRSPSRHSGRGRHSGRWRRGCCRSWTHASCTGRRRTTRPGCRACPPW